MVESAATKAAQQVGHTSMTSKQLQAVAGILRSHDTFVVVPTGYGRTLCYACLPLVFDQLFPDLVNKASIVVVITPLTATMTHGERAKPTPIKLLMF